MLKNAMPTEKHNGFTLVELLVVIAIIGVLVALLLPAIQAAREAARRMSCSNNLKQTAIALHNYYDVHKVFPNGTKADENGVDWSWSALILPYMEESNLHETIDFSLPYHIVHPANNRAIKTFIPSYHCPSAPPNEWVRCCSAIPGDEDAAETTYSATATHRDGDQAYYARDPEGTGVMFLNSKIKMADITDGTSNTLLVAECDITQDDPWKIFNCPNGCVLGKIWASENRVTTAYGINGTRFHIDAGVSSHHSGGAQFSFADGHIDFISETIDQAVLEALTTRAGEEVVDGSWP